jgi:RsiW-degrading membrane proteinase PrsW (M82 family)
MYDTIIQFYAVVGMAFLALLIFAPRNNHRNDVFNCILMIFIAGGIAYYLFSSTFCIYYSGKYFCIIYSVCFNNCLYDI